MVRFILILIPVAITVYALIDAITAPRDDVRSLPKALWIFLIVLLWIGGADDDPDFLADLDWKKHKGN